MPESPTTSLVKPLQVAERTTVIKHMEIYSKPEKFKYGWVAGFYDALSDDGRRYLDDILRYGARDGDDESFIAGYRAGRQARLGQVVSYSEPAVTHSKTAA
jgi:hypothetical protein